MAEKDKLIKGETTNNSSVERNELPWINDTPLEIRQIRGLSELLQQFPQELQFTQDTNLLFTLSQFIQDPGGDYVVVQIKNRFSWNVVATWQIVIN